MNVLDRVSKLPTDLVREIKNSLDTETYTELLLSEKLKYQKVEKTVKDNYYRTFVDDVNGSLEWILTNKIPTELETLNEWTGSAWHYTGRYPLQIPEELHYKIFKNNLYEPLMMLIKEDTLLSGASYIGTSTTRGLKMKERKHPLLQELKNLLSDYHLVNKPEETNERMMERYRNNLRLVMEKLRTRPKEIDNLVYLLKGIRSFNDEFDNKLKSILVKYLKAMVVLTKP